MPEKMLNQNIKNNETWKIFVSTGIIDDYSIRNIVKESWKRCKTYDLDPFSKDIPSSIDYSDLEYKRSKLKNILNISKPFMNSLYNIVGNTDFIIRFIDKDGYILDHIGEKGYVSRFGKTYLNNGYNIKEETIGTNAVGLVLITKKPIQILGSEHYIQKYHDFTTSASPIKDEQGNLLGVLSLTGYYKMIHPHTLGMVVAATEAIERELKLEKINDELQSMNKQFYEIMEAMSEGIIATTSDGTILKVNSFAKKLLHIRPDENISNKNIKRYLRNEIIYNRIFKDNKEINEIEIELVTEISTRKHCIVEVNYLKSDRRNNSKIIVFIINESKVIHNLVNKIVGATAIFTFDDIIGNSNKIQSTIELAKISANIDATILLLGESGTGKEMFAQAIHNASIRKNEPFVFINCGAIPRELVASELFGYVEGAFTGAKPGGHAGKFELADGGTIFLDEIGDMPLDTQVNLLRVLETKKVVRVGGNDVIPVNVRVIAATNKDLLREVELGNFREDLYYRLNVFPIHTPSLKERKEDIRIFVDYFVNKFSRLLNKKIRSIDKSFYNSFEKYDWPGNVRELQNTIQLVLNIAENDSILTSNNLPSHFNKQKLINEPENTAELLSLQEIEKMAIINTLEKTSYNLAQSAKILKIGRSTLYRKIEKYNI